GGPIHGRAGVHLTEKAYFVADRGPGRRLGDPRAAAALYRTGRRDLGEEGWLAFLAAANRLLRARDDGDPLAPAVHFRTTLDALRAARPGTPAAGLLDRLAEQRDRAEAYRAGLSGGANGHIPVLEPLLPAIVSPAAHWSAGGRAVRLVHDRQNILTPERIAWVEESARRAGIRLSGLELVVARSDARVQLADFLAGTARRIASDELNGRGDPALTALLRPYVVATSVWATPGAGAPSPRTPARRSTWPVDVPPGRTSPPPVNTRAPGAVWRGGTPLGGGPRGARAPRCS